MTNINNIEETYNAKIQQLEEEHRFALSKISHEIRNPVTLINSFLQLIESAHPEVKTFNYWSDVMENMEYLKSLLTELSDYNNSKKLHLQEVNPYRMLGALVTSIAPTLECNDIKLKLIKETAIPLLHLDVIKIHQVLLNLIRNASEAIKCNGTITIYLSSDGENVQIRISNDGPNIPPEHLDSLFEAFVTHKKEGTGLGLAIAKNVVESHNGLITVESSEAEHTTFTIVLPI